MVPDITDPDRKLSEILEYRADNLLGAADYVIAKSIRL